MATEPEPFDPAEWEVVPEDEPPLTSRDWEQALAGHIPRGMRRKVWHAMHAAGLVVFRA